MSRIPSLPVSRPSEALCRDIQGAYRLGLDPLPKLAAAAPYGYVVKVVTERVPTARWHIRIGHNKWVACLKAARKTKDSDGG